MSTVLVVDDDPGVLDVVAFTLRREGFDVDEESDGMRALAAARARDYDIVILDVMLPQMSGIASSTARPAAPRCGSSAGSISTSSGTR